MNCWRLNGWVGVLVLVIACAGVAGAMDLHGLPEAYAKAAQSPKSDPGGDHSSDGKQSQQTFHHCGQCQAHFLGTLTTDRSPLPPTSQPVAETDPVFPTEIDPSPPETPPKA